MNIFLIVLMKIFLIVSCCIFDDNDESSSNFGLKNIFLNKNGE